MYTFIKVCLLNFFMGKAKITLLYCVAEVALGYRKVFFQFLYIVEHGLEKIYRNYFLASFLLNLGNRL